MARPKTIIRKKRKFKGRVAVFLSGRGSNFEALYHSSMRNGSNYEIVVVISDNEDARGLVRARDYQLNCMVVSPKKFPSKIAYEKRLVEILEESQVELICLAGYMRIVGDELLTAYKNKIINIHPALLPSFPGLHGQKQAINYGVKISGCTVHFVDKGVDTGPIIMQRAVEVKEDDSEDLLSQRILAQEHKIYSQAVTLFFEERLHIEGRKVIISD